MAKKQSTRLTKRVTNLDKDLIFQRINRVNKRNKTKETTTFREFRNSLYTDKKITELMIKKFDKNLDILHSVILILGFLAFYKDLKHESELAEARKNEKSIFEMAMSMPKIVVKTNLARERAQKEEARRKEQIRKPIRARLTPDPYQLKAKSEMLGDLNKTRKPRTKKRGEIRI